MKNLVKGWQKVIDKPYSFIHLSELIELREIRKEEYELVFSNLPSGETKILRLNFEKSSPSEIIDLITMLSSVENPVECEFMLGYTLLTIESAVLL